jgi:hypothetical protein
MDSDPRRESPFMARLIVFAACATAPADERRFSG